LAGGGGRPHLPSLGGVKRLPINPKVVLFYLAVIGAYLLGRLQTSIPVERITMFCSYMVQGQIRANSFRMHSKLLLNARWEWHLII
jgi:hypothetical protein